MTEAASLVERLRSTRVPRVRLGDLVRIRNGRDHKGLSAGEVPVYGTGGVMTHVDTAAYREPSVLIPRKGSLDKLYFVDVPFWTVDTIFYTEIGDRLVPKYLYYFLSTQRLEEMNKAGGIPSLTQLELNEIQVPVPSLEVQRGIVQVLDQFKALEAELEAERRARRSQYEHYRARLLDQATSCGGEWSTLGGVTTRVSSGSTPRAGAPEYYDGGTIPWLRTAEVTFGDIWDTEIKITERALKETGASWIRENCVIVAISGATAARSAVNRIPLTTNQHCCNLQIDEARADYRYVFFWVSAKYEELRALGRGARGDLNVQIIKDFPIVIPALEEQRRIVGVLEKFDALVNDLSVGLPAELRARRQQYEYYRDKLLTFPEAAA